MKTQIRICLTVEFKANFLFFRSVAEFLQSDPAAGHLHVLKPQSLDDINKGMFLGRPEGDAQHLSNCPIRQLIRFYSFGERFRGF